METNLNPYQATTEFQVPPSPDTARRQLLPVAICMLVASILHIFGGFFYFTFVYSSIGAADADPDHAHMSIVFCMYYGITMLYCL